jgi:hypothetical protein
MPASRLATKSGNLLMKQLAIPLGCPRTATKWLAISSKLDVELILAGMARSCKRPARPENGSQT